MAALDLDKLIEEAAVTGLITTGATRAVVMAHTTAANRRLALAAPRRGKPQTNTGWSEADDEYLRVQIHHKPLAEIAHDLGRTHNAVKVHMTREMHLRGVTKGPNIVTANQAAYGLGLDSHTMTKLVERGLIPARRWQYQNGRYCFLIYRQVLAIFAVNPLNWIYFHPERINRPSLAAQRRLADKYPAEWFEKLRNLVLRRQALWDDEWWTPGQVAEYHECAHTNVNDHIRRGRIPAVKWGNWHILRSDAIALPYVIAWKGRGGVGVDHVKRTPAADAFLVLATALGLPLHETAALMKVPARQNYKRIVKLQARSRLYWLIRNFKLPVRQKGELLLADWKEQRARFPRLARAMTRLRQDKALTQAELIIVRSVLYTWIRFFARNAEQRAIEKSLSRVGGRRRSYHYRALVRRMRAAGVDPYRRL